MKKLLFFLLAVLLVASCRTNDSAILFTRYDSVGFHTVEDHSQIGEILHPGDTIWAHTAAIMDTVYHVRANTAEQWHYAAIHGNIWWMLLGVVIIVVGVAWFIKKNNGGAKEWTVAALIVVLAIGCSIAGTSLGWWAGYSADIKKPDYDAQIQQYGNLNLWFHNRLK
jgi:hypothetical protein